MRLPIRSKVCRNCKQEKPADNFVKDASNSDGLNRWCKDCKRSKQRSYYKNSPDQRQKHAERSRKSYLLKYYGITPEEYDRIASEATKCAICSEGISSSNMHLDHNHATGAIRGVLCGSCNMGIGLLKDSPTIISNALKYLNDNGYYGPAETRGPKEAA